MTSSTDGGASVTSSAIRWLTMTVLAMGAVAATQTAGVAAAAPIPIATHGAACSDVDVVFARGTFEPPGVGATGQAFIDSLTTLVAPRTVAVHPVDYPASLDFQTAAVGVRDAIDSIESIASKCPSTRIVVGGYSQGAAVAGYTTTESLPAGYALPDGIAGPMPSVIASHVAAVALFGTPDGPILNLLARDAPPIVIGDHYASKTIALCNPGDPVCFPGGLDRAAHSAYDDNGATDQAAAFAADHISTKPTLR